MWGYYGTQYRVRFYPPFKLLGYSFYIRNIILLGSAIKKRYSNCLVLIQPKTHLAQIDCDVSDMEVSNYGPVSAQTKCYRTLGSILGPPFCGH